MRKTQRCTAHLRKIDPLVGVKILMKESIKKDSIMKKFEVSFPHPTNFIVALCFCITVPFTYSTLAMRETRSNATESTSIVKPLVNPNLPNRLKDTFAHPYHVPVETQVPSQIEDQDQDQNQDQERETVNYSEPYNELGGSGSRLVPSLPLQNRAGTSMNTSDKTAMLPRSRGGPVEAKKGRYNQNRNKRQKQNKRGSSSEEIVYDGDSSELSTYREGDTSKNYVTRPKLTRMKEIARGGLTALTKLNQYGPFKRTLNEKNFISSTTFDENSMILAEPAQKNYYERFAELDEELSATNEKASSSTEVLIPNTFLSGWDRPAQKSVKFFRDFFNPEKHEIVLKVRKPKANNAFNPAFTLVALDRPLTREPLANLVNDSTIPETLKKAATKIFALTNNDPKGVLLTFTNLLRSEMSFDKYSYNALSKSVTIYSENEASWKKDNQSFIDSAELNDKKLTNMFNICTRSHGLSFEEAKTLFSNKNSKAVEHLAELLDEMVVPLTTDILDYSIHLEPTANTRYRVDNGFIQSIGVTDIWTNASSEELSTLFLNNTRKKVLHLDANRSRFVYDEPSEESERYTMKRSGTNPIKLTTNLADKEMVKLLSSSAQNTTPEKGELRGMGGFQSTRYSKERTYRIIGLTFFIALTSNPS